MAKRKLNFGGQEVTAEAIDFENVREVWNEYILHDGTTLRIKTVLAEVLRVDGAYTPSGDPVYIVNASPVVSSVSPDTLKQPKP